MLGKKEHEEKQNTHQSLSREKQHAPQREQAPLHQLCQDHQETAELIAHNRKYQLLSPAEQYFRLCFEVCQDPSEGEYMSAADIFQRIKQVAGSQL